MGSRLVETTSGETLWGFDRPSLFVSAWTTGRSIDRLAVTEAELLGDHRRVQPAGILRSPAYAPGFLGLDKYSRLLQTAELLTRDPSAVLEFAYDWRLSIEHNAMKLFAAATAHLTSWRKHPSGSADAKLVLIAHSMGGLVARFYAQVLGGAQDVRTTITLGTPYYGSPKTAYMMGTGRGAPVPLPHIRMKRLVRTMPGMYDLLPHYRALRRGDKAEMLTPADVAQLGGSSVLAVEATRRHERLLAGERNRSPSVGRGGTTNDAEPFDRARRCQWASTRRTTATPRRGLTAQVTPPSRDWPRTSMGSQLPLS